MTQDLLKNTANDSSKLNYSVLVEAKEDGYEATVWGLPDCQVFAQTREEALNNLHELVKNRLKNVEIIVPREEALNNLHELVKNRLKNVEIIVQEIEAPKTEHPWMKFAGKYKDDPQFDDMLAAIEAYRRELDAEMEEYYRKLDAEEEVK